MSKASNTSFWRGSGSWRGSSFPPSRGFPQRGTWRKSEESKPPTTKTTTPPPRGELVTELKAEELSLSEHNHDPKIRDCSYVASYSWADGESPSPTVIIPGKPPLWAPPAVNRRLEPDKGDFYRDPNAARYPSYPMEPAIQAVLKQHPQFPTQDIDIVTCTSALGNLSRFARGVEKEFRIILARVGTTVFLVRRENSPTELISDIQGYGHSFPDEYTKWEKDVETSVSHQRIVQYRLGGLHLLVRFGVDGYLRQESASPDHQPPEATSSIETLGARSNGHAIATATGKGGLQIKAGGRPIPQESIFDLKTRSQFDHLTRTIKKEINLTEILPRLWMAQVPNLIVGYHDRGRFQDIRVQDMRPEIESWEVENAHHNRRLASLLQELVEMARNCRTNLEICRSESGPLEIRRLADNGVEVLPPHLQDWWLRGPEHDQEATPQEDSSNLDKLLGNHVRLGTGSSPNVADEEHNVADYEQHWQADEEHNVPDYKEHWQADSEVYSDDESEKDYTACSESCEYCGHCLY
ncbi:hypothetical protein A1O3_00332 [Capronia epimyces CBS 606.96]|uniref:Geranylgeranyl pyrophosphate synthetase n=1 Tax=Capronia epimyces CBS 606.96 TaxID=1182542 RepID=W9YFW9_9EURO|nr:uncharacterized protein A1O3_00332 [Capronia epimyces CBS 606.96]EXJ91782.1 hypothetical protein A1O3_00332 [Capronia epimyces CBS 606.96]